MFHKVSSVPLDKVFAACVRSCPTKSGFMLLGFNSELHGSDKGGGEIFIDGDLLDGFFFLEGFKSNSGFEFGGQVSPFRFMFMVHFRG